MTNRTTSPPPPTTASADLESYLRVHRALRTSAAQFADAVATGDRPANALQRWYRGFAAEIRCHHHIEDELLFPALAARVATYSQYGPTLQSDHQELDELLDHLASALEDSDRSTSVSLARELSDHFHHHLDYEDDEIVPLFARHFTSAEFEELNKRAIRMTPPKQLVFTAPWMMSHLDDGERVAVLASAPKAMHLLWFATRRRYSRMSRRALGV
jgi:hypothetical protein